MPRIWCSRYIFFLLLIYSGTATAYTEKEYQKVWCDRLNGKPEYRLRGGSRVGCLTSKYAVEFAKGPKWAEAIGQALFYGVETNRHPAVVLIQEDPREERYWKRLKQVSDKLKTKRFILKIWKFSKG